MIEWHADPAVTYRAELLGSVTSQVDGMTRYVEAHVLRTENGYLFRRDLVSERPGETTIGAIFSYQTPEILVRSLMFPGKNRRLYLDLLGICAETDENVAAAFASASRWL